MGVSLVSPEASVQKVREHTIFMEFMRAHFQRIRAVHALLRASLRVSLACWLDPGMYKNMILRMSSDRPKAAMQLRDIAQGFEQEIAEDAAITCDVYRKTRLQEDIARQHAARSLPPDSDLSCVHGVWFRPTSFDRNYAIESPWTYGAYTRLLAMRRAWPSCVHIFAMFSAESSADFCNVFEAFYVVTEQNLSCSRLHFLDEIEAAFHISNVTVDAPVVGEDGKERRARETLLLSSFPADSKYATLYRQRFDIVRSHFDYLRARHAHIRAAVRLPSHLLSSAGLTPEMLEIRARIRAERRRDAEIRRREADELEVGLRTDLTPHIEAMVFGRCKGFKPESIFERMYLPDDAYRLIVKMLVNEGECGKDGNCNAGIDKLVPLKPKLPEKEPPCKRLCTGT
jgi:hypothetical protein